MLAVLVALSFLSVRAGVTLLVALVLVDFAVAAAGLARDRRGAG